MTQARAKGGYRFPFSQYGVLSKCVPHIDIIPEKFKKKIWEGKHANLASLLIPKVDKQHQDDVNHINVNIDTKEKLLKWLFNVTINDISVIHVTAHRCAGGLKKKFDLRSGSQRHRHFAGFFNVPVLVPTRDQPFYTVIPTYRPI